MTIYQGILSGAAVEHDETLTGSGTASSPLGIASSQKITQLTNIDVLASSFSLVSGFYEATIEHEDILSTHSVEVIPEKAYKSITEAAKFAEETDSFDGSVKIYCEVAPTADFQVTLNLIPVV